MIRIPIDRRYVIINVSDIDSIDFAQVLETSRDTVRYRLDGVKAVLKYEGAMPATISALSPTPQVYTRDEIRPIMGSIEWEADDADEV
jgi:hypothetical protein